MAEGNYLRKRRKSFYLSADCCQFLVDLAFKFGLSEGAVIEVSVREMMRREFGEWKSEEAPKFYKKVDFG